MKIYNNNNSPNFQARLVARAITPKSEFEILELDKITDANALKKISDSFTKENILQRFPDEGLLSVTLNFIKNTFNSINNQNTRSFLTISNGKPTGLMTFETSKPDRYIRVGYLAAWKPDGAEKPFYNGKTLIRHLFEEAKLNKTETIDLTPGFKSDLFYEKMGFEKDGFDVIIQQDKIQSSLNEIDKVIKYEPLEVKPQVDLIV